MDRLSDYDYDLPPELIAQHPLPQRDQARLLVVGRERDSVAHRRVCDLPEFLQPGDCLVFNDTRVVKARLFGVREATGGKWEGLFLGLVRSTALRSRGAGGSPGFGEPGYITDDAGCWRLIGQTRGRLQPGERIVLKGDRSASVPACTNFTEKRASGDACTTTLPADAPGSPALSLTLLERDAGGVWTAKPDSDVSAWEALERFGHVPLPPYIARDGDDADDPVRYQTVFARHPGAVAAPTAGLHFTPALLQRLTDRGIVTAFVTLHVGIGTFRPIAVDNLDEHEMHSEWCRVTEETATTLNRVRASGGRVVAVGTTSVRTLETSFGDDGFQATQSETRLFIRPPYRFRAVDAILTNFHLPKSSLLVLVSAWLGRDRTLAAYAEAIRERYRFFSYGDAMLLL